MTSPKEIVEALTGALAICWGLYVEFRMQKMQRADEQMKRKLLDVQITDSVHNLSDDQLVSKLSQELGGYAPPDPIKPKT